LTETNRQRLERFYQSAGAHDTDAVGALIHPDFAGYEADGLPYAGVYRGVAGWWKLVETVYGTWQDFAPVIEAVLGDEADEKFCVMLRVTGADAKSGEKFETAIAEYWRFKDEKLVEVRPFYWDTHLLHEVHKRSQAAA
jgi:ketosteroid isomerase-like protein